MKLRDYRFLVLVSLFMLLLVAVPTALADDSYTVQPGDNLYRIALRYGLTVDELAAANDIRNPHRLLAGQVLVIPANGDARAATESSETPTEGETGDQESYLEQVTDSRLEGTLAAINETVAEVDALVARQEALSAGSPRQHVVARGETLAQIGRRYGVTVAALVRANRLVSPNLIYPGQRLQVPSASAGQSGQPAALPPSGGIKRIVVDKSEQRAYVYQDGALLWTFVISTGMPGSETWEGTFAVRSKIPNAYAYNWGLQMPYWLGFYHTGYLENGFHALPIMSSGAVLWDGYLGTPVSYGCVILSYPDAETLYQWAEIGTEVIVQR